MNLKILGSEEVTKSSDSEKFIALQNLERSDDIEGTYGQEFLDEDTERAIFEQSSQNTIYRSSDEDMSDHIYDEADQAGQEMLDGLLSMISEDYDDTREIKDNYTDCLDSVTYVKKAESTSIIKAPLKFLKNYFNFNGHASRSDFWFSILWVSVIFVLLTVVFPPAGAGFAVLCLIPTCSLFARRYHDVSYSPVQGVLAALACSFPFAAAGIVGLSFTTELYVTYGLTIGTASIVIASIAGVAFVTLCGINGIICSGKENRYFNKPGLGTASVIVSAVTIVLSIMFVVTMFI